MAPITFEQFKSIFEFCIEVLGVGTAAAALWYRFDVVRAWWDVVRGHASRSEQVLATQTLRNAGPTAQMIVDRMAQSLGRHGHNDAAQRVREIAREVGLEGPRPEDVV